MKRRMLALITAATMFFPICSSNQMPCTMMKANAEKTETIETPAPLPTQTPPWGAQKDLWSDSTRIKTSGNYKYHILSEEKKLITIRKIENAKGKLTIPKEIDGYKVVGLGRSFELPRQLKIEEAEHEYDDLDSEEVPVLPVSSENVTEIEIPNYIQFVGVHAFENSKNLKKVKIDKRTKKLYLYGGAFTECKALKSVNLPKEVWAERDVFSMCGSIDKVTIEKTYLGDNFSGTNIKLLRIESKNKVFDMSYYDDGKINTISVGKDVKKIVLSTYEYYYYDFVNLKIGKIVVEGKNTSISGWNKKHKSLGKLYTVRGAKAIKWAKKHKLKYKVDTRKNIIKQIR